MKNMQDFHTWLSVPREALTPDQKRLNALTRLSRAQLVDVSSQAVWWIWGKAQAPAEPV